MSSLSILIPTLNERWEYLSRLKSILEPQIAPFKDRIEIYYHDAGRSMTTGAKRNALLTMARGEYFVFIDDDDVVSKNYISSIMNGIDKGVDVVTFNGWMTTNGKNSREFVIKLGEKYEERNLVYYRFPNHIVPMRAAVVRHIQFPHISMGEDYAWAKQINDQRLLKTSYHIEDRLYHYQFRTLKPSWG